MGKDKDKKKKKKDKKKKREEEARIKALRKAHETPEEKRLRRLEKKQRKHGTVEKQEEEICGYTNDKNHFGDRRITERFVWHKNPRAPVVVASKKEEKKRKELIANEVEKVKLRRAEREEENALWEEDKLRMMRERDAENYNDWEQKEEQKNRETNMLRSQIRIEQGRPKPIDLLAKNLALDTDFDCDIEEPYRIFLNLSLHELEDLETDIASYRDYDPHTEFWRLLMVVCQDEMEKLHAKERDRRRGTEDGLHSSIKDNVDDQLMGKSFRELEHLESQIQDKLNSGVDIDVEYWDALLKKIVVFKARERLREIHQEALTKKLEQLLEQQAQEADDDDDEEESEEEEDEDEDEEDGGDAEGGAQVAVAEQNPTEDAKMAKVKNKEGSEDEEDFADEIKLDNKVYWWQDKYRPRKPRYFNRVHTGYEWNKYNQTHYDHDNPPPKVVQGYKFNIFYSDLIDKTQTPQYFIEPAAEPDLVTIRFHAGPPYEDVAFKIVNREWESGHRRGYKCSFERGILHLYFRFRRYRYRR